MKKVGHQEVQMKIVHYRGINLIPLITPFQILFGKLLPFLFIQEKKEEAYAWKKEENNSGGILNKSQHRQSFMAHDTNPQGKRRITQCGQKTEQASFNRTTITCFDHLHDIPGWRVVFRLVKNIDL